MKSYVVFACAMQYCYAVSLGINEFILGIHGMKGGKPFLSSSRRLLFFNLFLYTGLLTLLVGFLFESESTGNNMLAALPVLSGLIVMVVPLTVRHCVKLEYMTYGFDDESLLRKTLHSSLTNLGIHYEKSSSGVRLPTLGIDLVVDDRKGFYSGRFRMKQWKFDRSLRRVLDDLVRNMNEHLRDSPNITFNSAACRWALAWYAVIIIVGGAITFHFSLLILQSGLSVTQTCPM